MIKASKEHLEIAQKSYWGHLWFALRAGFQLIYAGVISIIHGVCPFIFKFGASKIVMKFADLVLQRGNHNELPDEFKNNWDFKRK